MQRNCDTDLIMAVAATQGRRFLLLGDNQGFLNIIVVIGFPQSVPSSATDLVKFYGKLIPRSELFEKIEKAFRDIGVSIIQDEHLFFAINETKVLEEQRLGKLGIIIGNVPRSLQFLWGLVNHYNQKLAVASTDTKRFFQVGGKNRYHNIVVAIGFTESVPSIQSASSDIPGIRFYGKLKPDGKLFTQIQEAFFKIGVFLNLTEHYFFAIDESIVPMELKSPGITFGKDIPKFLKFLWKLEKNQLQYEALQVERLRKFKQQIEGQQTQCQELYAQRQYEIAEFLASNPSSSLKRSADETYISSVVVIDHCKDIVCSKISVESETDGTVKRKKKNPKEE